MSLLNEVVKLAWQAGDKILQIYNSGPINSTLKLDKSPVTEADLAADKILTRGLLGLSQSVLGTVVESRFGKLPKMTLISEESGEDPGLAAQRLATEEACWLVDPLDGTRDFVAKTDDFAICVALVKFGQPILGVIHAPAHRVTLGAVRGQGTWKFDDQRRGDSPTKIYCHEVDLARFVLLVSRFHLGKSVQKLKDRFPHCTYLQAGSAYKYGLICLGKADLSVRTSPTSAWDIAAAQCILEEAGGGIVDFDEKPLRYGGDSLINPPLIAHGLVSQNFSNLVRQIKEVVSGNGRDKN